LRLKTASLAMAPGKSQELKVNHYMKSQEVKPEG
jgi:hypothetical protein